MTKCGCGHPKRDHNGEDGECMTPGCSCKTFEKASGKPAETTKSETSKLEKAKDDFIEALDSAKAEVQNLEAEVIICSENFKKLAKLLEDAKKRLERMV